MAEEARQRGLFYPGAEVAEEIERRTASPRPGADEPLVRKRGVQRRTVFRWVGWGTLMLLLAQFSAGFVGFFWPKKVGAFGGEISAGAVSDLKLGDVRVFQEGKFYLSRVPEGVLALWWKCPHLGCTVPWRPEFDFEGVRGWFRCPCHGSTYTKAGIRVFGPAPRPMDTFDLAVNGDGSIDVNTSKVTPGSSTNPQRAVLA